MMSWGAALSGVTLPMDSLSAISPKDHSVRGGDSVCSTIYRSIPPAPEIERWRLK